MFSTERKRSVCANENLMSEGRGGGELTLRPARRHGTMREESYLKKTVETVYEV